MSEPALEGDLARFAPAEVLQLLQLAQSTGRLDFTRPRGAGIERVEVWFESGHPIAARTSAGSARTGEILLHRGHASAEAIERALERQRAGDRRRLGTLLADAGAPPGEVGRAVREALLRVLYGVLTWREGRFEYVPDARIERDGLDPDLDLDRVILEGLRLADQARAPGA